MAISEQRAAPPAPNNGGARIRPLLLSALSGLLLVAAFPHGDAGWLAFVALVPFLLTYPHTDWKRAAQCGAVLGITFFGGLFYWVAVFASHPVGPVLGTVAWMGVALSQMPTLVLFAVGAHRLHKRGGLCWSLGVPALWTLLEWGRQWGILGTGWGDLGYTQHGFLPLLQLCKLTGVWGLSFLIVWVNVQVTEAVRARRPYSLAFPLLATGGAVLLGLWSLHTERLRPSFTAAALQGNVNQDTPLTPQYVQRVQSTFSRQALEAHTRGATLTVWPETALPGYLQTDLTLRLPILADAARYGQNILVGARGADPATGKDTNTLFLVRPDGTVSGAYSKQKLVPFGEYVPLRRWLPFLDALHLSIYDMAPGASRQPLIPMGTVNIGAAVCYDSTDGDIMRSETERGANILVVSTDDTWFGRTAAARQHAAMSAVRACESDRYLIRCAATGVSQVIDPAGRVIAEAGLFQQKVVSAPVEARSTRTPYVRYGDWFVLLCGIILAGSLAPNARDRRAGTARSSGR